MFDAPPVLQPVDYRDQVIIYLGIPSRPTTRVQYDFACRHHPSRRLGSNRLTLTIHATPFSYYGTEQPRDERRGVIRIQAGRDVITEAEIRAANLPDGEWSIRGMGTGWCSDHPLREYGFHFSISGEGSQIDDYEVRWEEGRYTFEHRDRTFAVPGWMINPPPAGQPFDFNQRPMGLPDPDAAKPPG